jgi:hypothetical protein
MDTDQSREAQEENGHKKAQRAQKRKQQTKTED